MKPIRTWSTRLSIALILMAGLAPATAHASGSPASPVPASRWGTLEPVQIIGDFTSFIGQSDPKAGNTLQWYDVDIENDFLYTTTGQGLQIFSLANPASPTNLSYIYGWISGSAFPVWNYSDKDWYIKDLDVPEGNDALVAIGMEEQGFAVVNAGSKTTPVVSYQSALDTSWVHAARVAGKDYAWAVERSGGKIDLYDMTKAATYSMCHEAPPQIACSGVFKGAQSGLGNGWSSIDGTGNFLALGRGGRTGFARIFNIADPTTPVQVMEVASPATAVGLWKIGNFAMYLATMDLAGKTMSIYDASCALSGRDRKSVV